MSSTSAPPPRAGSAAFVAAGILLSRVAGFIRMRVFAHYFGISTDAAGAFSAAFRIPNLLQNLFGEAALSASFIPVYAALRARGETREADRVAGAVASLLAVVTALLVLIGVLIAPLLVYAIAPGFTGANRELTVTLVRILFPGAGLLVMSAWCLGVLNSHYRFLLSYTAPILWNIAMIATLVLYGRTDLPRLAVLLAWGSVIGSALQFLVQAPAVWRAAPDLRFALHTASPHVRTIARNFIPVFVSRGVVQLSAYIDTMLASFLSLRAVAGLANAQLLYTLPVSLFGMSVSAAELPAMSGVMGADGAGAATVRRRLEAGLRQIAFFIVPSAMAFLALGDVIAAALFQTGRFEREDSVYVWGILAGSAVGLLASTLGRLYASTCYAFGDTRAPLRCALVRVALTTALGYVFAIHAPAWLGLASSWGAAGLTASAGLAGWVEMFMLRRIVASRVGGARLPVAFAAQLWTAAALAAAAAWLIKLLLPPLHPALSAALILCPYGAVFLAITALQGMPETATAMTRLKRLGRRS